MTASAELLPSRPVADAAAELLYRGVLESMMQREFVLEAAECRAKAEQFKGRFEEAFLLRVAAEFEDLSAARERETIAAAQRRSA